ncbi:MAG TPA: ribose 5-phosphate isomerase B [Papillibacter sp.]|jgi:ribose 5-phosphate isomerase B|nr:ribose 5-phosphate isomerase B [Papillibacter sp.]
MLAIGSDHGGFELKKALLDVLNKQGIEVKDFGTYSCDSCDYPAIAGDVCRAILSGECDRGVLICGTGIGMSMAANRFSGIRAALCSEPYSAEMTRRHNDANILVLGARVIGPGLAEKILDIYLNTPFDGGRHARRVTMLEQVTGSDENS